MSAGAAALGLYVHWPFCKAKCPYCDFNSHVRHAPIDQERFARAFAREIETTAARIPGREVSSIFLGGGIVLLAASLDVFRRQTALFTFTLALGAGLGFFGGLFGIGGGIIAIPLLVLGFGMEQPLAL